MFMFYHEFIFTWKYRQAENLVPVSLQKKMYTCAFFPMDSSRVNSPCSSPRLPLTVSLWQKSLLIAVWRLCRNWLALSVIASQCHLSQRERLWQAGPLPTGRLSPDMAQKGGPCYRGQQLLDNAPCQAAAALDSGALQPTKRINFARSVGT